MYRVVKLSGKFYAKQMSSIMDDEEDITTFVEEGSPVIIVNEIADLEMDFDITEEEVEIV